eukprot:3828985-Amphidinium_carterae.1
MVLSPQITWVSTASTDHEKIGHQPVLPTVLSESGVAQSKRVYTTQISESGQDIVDRGGFATLSVHFHSRPGGLKKNASVSFLEATSTPMRVAKATRSKVRRDAEHRIETLPTPSKPPKPNPKKTVEK